jgi:hypothetical protein
MMLKMRVVYLLFVTGAIACGSAATVKGGSSLEETGVQQKSDAMVIAELLERRGYYLEASYYYEAALANGGDEDSILPRLICTQIRANRLRAAKQGVERLREIDGDNETIASLLELLHRLAPALAEEGNLRSKREEIP